MSSPTIPAAATPPVSAARPTRAAAGADGAALAPSARPGPDSSAEEEEEWLECRVQVRENRVGDLFDDETREATRSLTLRLPASAMTTELIRLVNVQLRAKWTLTVLANGSSSSSPTAATAGTTGRGGALHFAVTAALPVQRPLLPAVPPLPDHAPLSTVWPAGGASLRLCVPSFRPIPSVTVVVAVVAPYSTPPHSESLNLRRELYELYVETGDAREVSHEVSDVGPNPEIVQLARIYADPHVAIIARRHENRPGSHDCRSPRPVGASAATRGIVENRLISGSNVS